jgi:hypothetical protein
MPGGMVCVYTPPFAIGSSIPQISKLLRPNRLAIGIGGGTGRISQGGSESRDVDATSVLRCTQANSINIMVTERVSWYKYFTFQSCQRGVPTLFELQRQGPRRAPQT